MLKKALMQVHSTRCRIYRWYRNKKSATETEAYVELIGTTMTELSRKKNNENIFEYSNILLQEESSSK